MVLGRSILLTHDDLSDRKRYLNARSTLRALLDLGVIPVINENDTVVTDEIRFGDNDTLGALVTNLVEADLLVILTDRDGLYEADPRHNPDAQLVDEATENTMHGFGRLADDPAGVLGAVVHQPSRDLAPVRANTNNHLATPEIALHGLHAYRKQTAPTSGQCAHCTIVDQQFATGLQMAHGCSAPALRQRCSGPRIGQSWPGICIVSRIACRRTRARQPGRRRYVPIPLSVMGAWPE